MDKLYKYQTVRTTTRYEYGTGGRVSREVVYVKRHTTEAGIPKEWQNSITSYTYGLSGEVTEKTVETYVLVSVTPARVTGE